MVYLSSQYGKKIRISIFGQSHSSAVGVTIDGVPAGIEIDTDELRAFMQRRAPGRSALSTARHEDDEPEIISGLVDGMTCGAPMAIVIRNKDARSEDYREVRDIPRPSHADYTAHIKFGGYQDIAGGGHFSGRLTAPLCAAGGICIQALKKLGVHIGAHIQRVEDVSDDLFDPVGVSKDDFDSIRRNSLPVLNAEAGYLMEKRILNARDAGDSVGGVVECAAIGLPAGIGDPMFEGVENRIAEVVFGIPAVKGVEFGSGFAGAALRGSVNNDAFYYDGDMVKTRTNNSGGILGGITNAMPVLFRAAFKPTPSIGKEQESVSLSKGMGAVSIGKGRHDPCIVPRGVVCVEAAAAIALFDAY